MIRTISFGALATLISSIPARFRIAIMLLGALVLATPAVLAAGRGEDSQGLWQININVGVAKMSSEPTPGGGRPSQADVALSIGNEQTSAGRPSQAHVAISLGDGRTIEP